MRLVFYFYNDLTTGQITVKKKLSSKANGQNGSGSSLSFTLKLSIDSVLVIWEFHPWNRFFFPDFYRTFFFCTLFKWRWWSSFHYLHLFLSTTRIHEFPMKAKHEMKKCHCLTRAHKMCDQIEKLSFAAIFFLLSSSLSHIQQ